MITQEDAIQRAKEKLKKINAPYEKRKITVSLDKGRYTVIFHPPEGMLAGKFTIIVNGYSGEIIQSIIGR